MHRWLGVFNWKGEIHTLWTHAPTPWGARRNFFKRLIRILELDKEHGLWTLKNYFHKSKPNHRIVIKPAKEAKYGTAKE